jgi:hypothetical protein
VKTKATLGIAVAALSAAFVAGLLFAHADLVANRVVVDLDRKVRRLVSGVVPERPVPDRTVPSTFLRLRLQTVKVPVDRPGAGGGLTSMDDALLLLTHEGAIWSVHGMSPQRTRISAPNNNFAAYKVAGETGKYRHLKHALEFFRYNDILHYEDAAGQYLIVSYTEWRPELECYGTALARLPLELSEPDPATMATRPDEWEVFFRTKPCLPLKDAMRALEGHMAGGRIANAGRGKIILGSGDYHWDGLYAPKSLPQETDNDYGKVLEIDVATGESQHLSIGNRNVQGIMVDRDGRVWAVEHGPRGGDELNLVQKGRNFGWPEATLGTRYSKLPWPTTAPYGRHDGFDAPIHAWLPSVGVSNLVQIEGFDSTWDGDFLVGSLKAGTLFRLRETDGRILFAEPIEIGERIRYVHQHTDGRIVLWTDDGELVFVGLTVVRLHRGNDRETTTRTATEGRIVDGHHGLRRVPLLRAGRAPRRAQPREHPRPPAGSHVVSRLFCGLALSRWRLDRRSHRQLPHRPARSRARHDDAGPEPARRDHRRPRGSAASGQRAGVIIRPGDRTPRTRPGATARSRLEPAPPARTRGCGPAGASLSRAS